MTRAKGEEERRKQKETVAKLKAQQRSEVVILWKGHIKSLPHSFLIHSLFFAQIYALNKVMAEFEEQKFQASISGKV